MEGLLHDRVVVVVGAGSHGGLGLGEAAARTYAREGAVVAVLDRDPLAAEAVVATIRESGGRASPWEVDATDEKALASCLDDVVSELGAPQVLHNNVGRVLTGAVTELERGDWDALLATNLTSAFLACKHVLPWMLPRRRGSIVNVSSLAGIRVTGYDYPAYAASKAALNQLTVSLALAHARDGIRVNAVLPGLIASPMARAQLGHQEWTERHRRSPTGHMGSPWDVAEAALFLASDRAAYVNGVLLPVDGGLAARVS